jgi:hypothetical protein
MHVALSRSLFDDRVGRWPPDLAQARGWILHRVSYPVIDCEFTSVGRTPLRLYCDFADWDEQPPSVVLQSSSGALLQTLPPNPTGVFNGGAHPTTGRPFICTPGVKEFHVHSSHVNERWDQFRGKPGFDLGDIITKLWHAWLKGSG